MFTNGSARPVDWWTQLASIVDEVHFGIDGLGDTNAIYRRGTQWEKIMANCRTYIEAGGSATWDFIVFRHNEHQIAEAQQLSEKLGFKQFHVKKTARFFSNSRNQVKNQQAILDGDGRFHGFLQQPKNEKYQNSALKREQALIERFGSLNNYMGQCEIRCKVQAEKSLYISAEGLVFPCCWLANQLYVWYSPSGHSQIEKLVNASKGGRQAVDAKIHELADILQSDFFQKKLPSAWEVNSSPTDSRRLRVCAKTCGTEFDPFRHQFE